MSAEIASLFVTLSSSVVGYNDPLRTAQATSAEFEAANKRMADAVVADNARIVESSAAMARATRADELSATVGAAPLAGVMGGGALEGEAAAIRSSTAETDAAVAASSAGIRERVGEAARATGESEGLIGGAVGRTREHFGELLGVGEMLKPLAAITIGGFAIESVGHFSEVGQAAYELSEKFGILPGKASQILAAGQAIGVSTESMSTGLKFLSKDMLAAQEAFDKGTPSLEKVKLAQESVTIAQTKLDNALKAHGPSSLQALEATKSLTTAQDALASAMQGAGGKIPPAVQALNRMGISVVDVHGHMRDVNDVLKDAATQFEAMPDGPEKAALALKIFGRSGTDMLPILNEGAAGLQQLEQQAISSGAALSGPQVDAAHKAYLAHQQLDAALTGVGNALGSVLAPALGAIAPALTAFSGWFSGPGMVGIQSFGSGVISDVGPPIRQFVGWIGTDLLPKLDHLWQSIQTNVLPTLESLGKFFLEHVLPPMEAVAGFIADKLLGGIQWISDHFDALKPILVGVGTAFAIMAGEMAIGAVLDGLVTAFWAINGVLDVLAVNPVVLIFVALAAVAFEIYQHWDKVKQILGIVGGALLSFGHAVKDFLGNVLGDIGGFFESFGSFFEGIGDSITHFFEDLPRRILGALSGAGTALVHAGGDLLSGLYNGVLQNWPAVAAFFITLPARVMTYMIGAEIWLLETGGKLLVGLLKGIFGALPGIVEFFGVTLPKTIWTLVIDADKWLLDTGVKLLTGLFRGAVSGAVALWNFWTSMPGKVLGFFTAADTWLLQKGTDVIYGLYKGALTFWQTVIGWIRGVPGAILGAIGDLGGLLWGVGKQLIQGFIGGIKSMFGDVKDTLGGLAGDLVRWKGPPSKDAVLLTDNGRLVIKGFIAGLESQYAAVHDTLGGFGASLPGALAGSVTGTLGAPMGNGWVGLPAGGGGGPSTTTFTGDIHIHIEGSADPRATAREVRDALLLLKRQQGFNLGLA